MGARLLHAYGRNGARYRSWENEWPLKEARSYMYIIDVRL